MKPKNLVIALTNLAALFFYPAFVVQLMVDGNYRAGAAVAGIFGGSLAFVFAGEKFIYKPIARRITMHLIARGWRFGNGVLLPPKYRPNLES